jgi:restriction system protein
MAPVLACYTDGGSHPVAEVRSSLAERFELSDDELAERLPSGTARTFDNRVRWATTYLHGCGLLTRPTRGVYAITERGLSVLNKHPDRIDLSVLSQFPELEVLRSRSPRTAGMTRTPSPPIHPPGETQTPEERIIAAYAELGRAAIAELYERVCAMSSTGFEDLVIDVLRAMGYGAEGEGSRLRVADHGIDGVMYQDRLGLDAVYVQAKRWDASVGRPSVQGFVGALHGVKATKGIMFASSDFSREAREYAATVTPRVILIGGHRLAELMYEHDVGVTPRETYTVKRVDSDYFGDDGIV